MVQQSDKKKEIAPAETTAGSSAVPGTETTEGMGTLLLEQKEAAVKENGLDAEDVEKPANADAVCLRCLSVGLQ